MHYFGKKSFSNGFVVVAFLGFYSMKKKLICSIVLRSSTFLGSSFLAAAAGADLVSAAGAPDPMEPMKLVTGETARTLSRTAVEAAQGVTLASVRSLVMLAEVTGKWESLSNKVA